MSSSRGTTQDVLYRPQHEYTQLLISEHEQYGPERASWTLPGRSGHDRPPSSLRSRTSRFTTGSAAGAARFWTGSRCRSRTGEAVGLIGETGSGKSTLALVPCSDSCRSPLGRVVIDGQDVSKASKRPVAGAAPPGRGAVRLPGTAAQPGSGSHRSRSQSPSRWSSREMPGTQAHARARAFLGRVRLDAELLDRSPVQLSGGQRQRVAVGPGCWSPSRSSSCWTSR